MTDIRAALVASGVIKPATGEAKPRGEITEFLNLLGLPVTALPFVRERPEPPPAPKRKRARRKRRRPGE